MVEIMDIPNSRGRESFWEAYRACAEENKVRPDRSPEIQVQTGYQSLSGEIGR